MPRTCAVSILFIFSSLAFLTPIATGAQNSTLSNDASKAKSDQPDVDAQKAALIRRISDTSLTAEMRQQMFDTALRQTASVLQSNPIYPTGFILEFQRKLKDRLVNLDLTQFLIPIYAKEFTMDELQQIENFQSSPVGRKLVSLQPGFYRDLTASISTWSREAGMQAAREVLAEHPDYEKQIEERQRKANANAGVETFPPYDGPVERIGNGVDAPALTNKTEPQYSKAALDAKLEGTVLLSLVVDTDGRPRNIRVIRPLGMGLDEKAIEAVSQWRFKPGKKSGRPVATLATIEVTFRLVQNPPAS